MTARITDTFFNLFNKEGLLTQKDVLLKSHTTFKIGGAADLGVYPRTPEEFKFCMDTLTSENVPLYVMGRGSNLLVHDRGFRGAVVFTEELQEVKFIDSGVSAGAGAGLTALSRKAGEKGLSGLEFACGIPGSVGGAVAMNAGAYGGEISDVFKSCLFYRSGEGLLTCELEPGMFSYRKTSFLKNHDYVLEVVFSLKNDRVEDIKAREEELLFRRRDKQPLEYPSAGSAFKRPEGYFAAKLIEDAGLKGKRVGGAQVSEKHSGFIINTGGASSQDVAKLISLVRDEVFSKFGVTLEPEIRYLSEQGESNL